jgi:undecaprenyl-diphosphatase
MTSLESIVLGAVQGITEFLPVSSSAHLIVVPWLFRIDEGNVNQLTFDVILHFGTLFAVLLSYGRRFALAVIDGLTALRRGRVGDSLLLKLAVATCPAAIAGLLGKTFIESYLRTPFVAVFGLISVSILMLISERVYVDKGRISYPVAIVIGLAQAVALVPGTSRSGITIVAGMLLGLRRSEAVDFSFMLSIPIILGTSFYELRHVQYDVAHASIYVWGMLSSFAFGALSLEFLVRYLKKHSLDLFAVYRFALALLILLFAIH